MKKTFYLIIGLIFLLSFRFYSSLFYPILNSDNGASILMIYYFKLPHDLYYWGLDRMGSLIQLVAQIFFKGFGFSALISEAITHYLILLAGYLAFSTFLKSNFYKIIFAIIWFFPPMRLIDVTQFAFGIYYGLIAIACYLFNLNEKGFIKNNSYKHHLILILITLTLITAVWVSDMALISIFLLLMVQIYFYLKTNKLTLSIFKKLELYYGLAGILIGYFFIHYAKSIATNREDYSVFSDLDTIKEVIVIFWNSLSDMLIFNANEPFTSVYTYFVILILGVVIFQFKNIKLKKPVNKWLLFFLLDAILVFIVIMVSKWTFLNGVPRRYFTCTYISLAFTVLLALDNLEIKITQVKIIKTIVLTTVFIGGIGTLYNIKYIWPKIMTPRVEVVKEFERLGKIGIISEYWNSYITSCGNPDLIKATPNDESIVRSYDIVEEVFQQKNIYVIRDMWLQTFPDTLNQFGHVLIKNGEEFYIGDCYVCKYEKIK
jgi:hypothetical protein